MLMGQYVGDNSSADVSSSHLSSCQSWLAIAGPERTTSHLMWETHHLCWASHVFACYGYSEILLHLTVDRMEGKMFRAPSQWDRLSILLSSTEPKQWTQNKMETFGESMGWTTAQLPLTASKMKLPFVAPSEAPKHRAHHTNLQSTSFIQHCSLVSVNTPFSSSSRSGGKWWLAFKSKRTLAPCAQWSLLGCGKGRLSPGS